MIGIIFLLSPPGCQAEPGLVFEPAGGAGRAFGGNFFNISGLSSFNETLEVTLTGIYDNIVKEYVEDVYIDVIETYVISTIKVKAKPRLFDDYNKSLSLADWLAVLRSFPDTEGRLPERCAGR